MVLGVDSGEENGVGKELGVDCDEEIGVGKGLCVDCGEEIGVEKGLYVDFGEGMHDLGQDQGAVLDVLNKEVSDMSMEVRVLVLEVQEIFQVEELVILVPGVPRSCGFVDF